MLIRRGWATLSIVLVLCGWLVALSLAATGMAPADSGLSTLSQQASPSGRADSSRDDGVPRKARDLLKQLQERHGEPLPSYVGGRTFLNRERRLPPGRYREYDVNPKIPGRSRDAERLVIEQRTGRAYYTGDHYRTFIRLDDGP